MLSPVDLLEAKEELLRQREREIELLRRAHNRTAAWLRAFLRLVEIPLGTAKEIEAEWTLLMSQDLGFQTAAIFELRAGDGRMELSCGQSSIPLPAVLEVSPQAHERLQQKLAGVYHAAGEPELAKIARGIGLERFLWFLFSGLGKDDRLLVAGSSSGDSTPEEDLPYFEMLGRHAAILLWNNRLLIELDAERRALDASLRKERKTQEQLLQASKMAAVGQLAAGVAHEINNPLTVILGFAQGVERRLSPPEEHLRPSISWIVREALRCKNLIHELLTFSHEAPKTVEPVELRSLLGSAEQLLEPRAKAQNTQILIEAGPDNLYCSGNKTQLEQVLINLGNNALDALQSGGKVTLRLLNCQTEALLEVEDTGPGIPEEIQGRIFEPFFTTKGVGQGTGLGLSLVYEIIQQHRGAIEVQSSPKKGALLRLRLPLEART